MKSNRSIIVLVLIAVVIAISAPALILANFSAMSSKMERSSTLTSVGSSPNNQPILPAATGLNVSGKGRLARSLQNQLAKNLDTKPGFGQVQPVGELSKPLDYPILLVEVEPQSLVWTPVYARANLKVTVYYDSDGELPALAGEPAKVKSIGSETIIQRSGEYAYTDVSWGLISYPGYLDYLAKEAGKQIAEDLIAQSQ